MPRKTRTKKIPAPVQIQKPLPSPVPMLPPLPLPPMESQLELDRRVLAQHPKCGLLVRDYLPGESELLASEAVIVVRNGQGLTKRIFTRRDNVLAIVSSIEAPYLVQNGSVVEQYLIEAGIIASASREEV